MKRIGIISYDGVACAFAAAAIKALADSGADVHAMTFEEARERAVELAPSSFPIYTERSTAYPAPRFNGYMKNRRRY